MREPIVVVDALTVHYPYGRKGFWGRQKLFVHAVDDVSFEVFPGETLGLVGESGSGKTTIGRTVLRRVEPKEGRILYKGQDITHLAGKDLRAMRKTMQAVFQDPYASLNPRMSVLEIVAEPLMVHGLVHSPEEARPRINELLDMTGLSQDAADLYPHAFSGGQRQRIGIARALALEPEFIVADEPVSALDVSIQAQIVNLLSDLQNELGLTYLFIAHDLAIVRQLSHRIAVMYGGKLVEIANRDAIYVRPLHPYTQALLSAIPIPEPRSSKSRERIILKGEIPNPVEPPSGCRFLSRCIYSDPELCLSVSPPLREVSPGHSVACHFAEDIESNARSVSISSRNP